ncbi:MAG: hypothetical protein IPL61_35595 [Myxococcales bacterium]|nr:hypothetical protein [Myxococcales bacterium]
MEVFVVVIVVAAIGGVVWGIVRASTRRDMLRELAASLGGEATSNTAAGQLDGVRVRLEFATRGSGSSSESWTYVDGVLPSGYPLVLHLEEHGWFDAGKIARGEMIDVVVGDLPFDQKFRIEGAPADVVQRLLTPPTRAYLLAQRRVELTTTPGNLRMAVRGWLEQPADARAALALVAGLASGLRAASLALDAEVPMTTGAGGAYRAGPDDAPLRAAREARAEEVARVEATRTARLARQRFIVIAIAVAIAAVLATMIAAR